MKRWDFSIEGQTCPVCQGTTWVYEIGDAHKSSGNIPCPRGSFQGHGYPICFKGKLKFSNYDKKNKNILKRKYK